MENSGQTWIYLNKYLQHDFYYWKIPIPLIESSIIKIIWSNLNTKNLVSLIKEQAFVIVEREEEQEEEHK